ncbi:histidine kinase/DNA gyrase B/HSP90-like ATPase [Ulvibacter sp. MAR_2010_11]|uniref:sensor histidine kinase n=1 Tax=Ulvibacter sp. MAR_2010_11 TaxID=1250229 RepID=UPI000C2B99F3|nr:HAMP domain-containing sensor histidine kinase [Ulvibacter sp. MAR_2010_11]PKA82685.1 histidine kinase/DNA gyrase B/HSP90-like ATPase [Ulvibacter sp. MAR_2010_11]
MQNKNVLTRWFFIVVSVFIISLILWNTYVFFNRLKENERAKMQVWASAQEEFQKVGLGQGQINNLVLEVLQSNTTTPMIVYTHREDSYNDVRNMVEKEKDPAKLRESRKALTKVFASENKPIEVTYKGEVLQTIYYGNSPTINKLKYYPAVLILIILLFFVALYFFYQTSKSAEQNRLWAGMAKETAHQIGTPLSSLVGWTEILKTENINPEYVVEIEKDVDRLRTITERFSKIGSIPKLERKDLVAETRTTFDYLKRRSSKLIEFELEVLDEPMYVALNPQLYSWTIENLVKNAIDAMRGKGKILVTIESSSKYALVRVADSGKGIPKKNFSKIFQPGFTTKSRGWGLGLSLVKRIVEEYHDGKIRVLKSSREEGTIMEISFRLYS